MESGEEWRGADGECGGNQTLSVTLAPEEPRLEGVRAGRGGRPEAGGEGAGRQWNVICNVTLKHTSQLGVPAHRETILRPVVALPL